MNGNTVLINVATSTGGTGQLGFDLGLISRIDAPAPPAFQAGYAAYTAGEWDKALASLKPLVAQFHGLPTDWARQATGILGDVYVEKNDLTNAEAAYNDFRRLYPGGAGNTLRATLGQARIAFARNNVAAARQGLEPIKQAALKRPGGGLPTRRRGVRAGVLPVRPTERAATANIRRRWKITCGR